MLCLVNFLYTYCKRMCKGFLSLGTMCVIAAYLRRLSTGIFLFFLFIIGEDILFKSWTDLEKCQKE